MISQLPGGIKRLLEDHMRAYRTQHSIIISGRPDSGKSTLANWLINQIPDESYAISIEDESAAAAPAIHSLSTYQSRMTFTTSNAQSRSELTKRTWGLQPDWVVQDELDSAATAHLTTYNLGYSIMATMQADTGHDAFAQLGRLLDRDLSDITERSIFTDVANTIPHLIIHVRRSTPDVDPQIVEVLQLRPATKRIKHRLETLYKR